MITFYRQFLAAVSLVILLGGCKGPDASPDIVIVDISTGKLKHPKYASMRQTIISVDTSNRLFRTLVKSDDHLILRTLNRECEEMKVVPIPLFTDGYCSRHGRALSPEGDRIVYFREGTHALCLYDLSTCQESEVWPYIASDKMDIPKVEWLSDSELLIVRQQDGRGSTNEIIVLHLVLGTKHRLATPVYLSYFDYSVSPDRRLLAYWEGREKHSIYGQIKVLDLRTGKIVATIGSGGDELTGHPSWSFDGKMLAYVEGRRILVFSLDTGNARAVTVLPDNTITYNLLMGQNLIIHHGAKDRGGGSYEKLPVMIIDCQTGSCLKEIAIDVNGQTFFLERDQSIVCEIGY